MTVGSLARVILCDLPYTTLLIELNTGTGSATFRILSIDLVYGSSVHSIEYSLFMNKQAPKCIEKEGSTHD